MTAIEKSVVVCTSSSSDALVETYSIRHIAFGVLYRPHDRIYHKLLVSWRYIEKGLKTVRVDSLKAEMGETLVNNLAKATLQTIM
jgi:hypothetical protein